MSRGFTLAALLVTLLCCPLSAWTYAEDASVEMIIQVGDHMLTATLAENTTAEALITLLQEGPITIDMHDYASMEKVGALPISLPKNDEQINTEPGDLIVYQGNQFVIYYDTNAWFLTRLGRINEISQRELKGILGNGDVTVVLLLHAAE